MHDTYPGSDEPERSGVHKVNQIVYKGLADIFRRSDGEIPHPNSTAGQDMLDRMAVLGSHGVEESRVATLSCLAHLHGSREAEAAELKSFNELAALMEEAPGA